LEILVRPAVDADMPQARAMLREYVQWIGLDLAFQEIDAELAGLPGDYAPPRGAMFVALDLSHRSGEAAEADGPRHVGMIALRPLEMSICEMKRLFVRPEARGRGLARQLITRLTDTARQLGYTEIRLDTLPMMGDAQALYEACGFVDIAPYYETPIAGTRFMSKRL
jgi:GNAT superfamily N-acetyltransferase